MRKFAILAAMAAAVFAGPASAYGYGDFNGDWENSNSSASDLTRVTVTPSGSDYRVHAFGRCHPSDCDWGDANGTAYSDSVGGGSSPSALEMIATYRTSFSESILILEDRSGDRLGYSLYTRFTDRSGRRAYVVHGSLERAHDSGGHGPGGHWPRPGGGGGGPGGGGPGGGGGGGSGGSGGYGEDCVSLDWSSAAITNVGGQWMLVDGTHQLLAFGSNIIEANAALQVVRHYRFTQHCFIGRPNPTFDYWKAGSSIPGGTMGGADCINNNPSTTHAQYVSGEWKLVDGSHWLVSFGSKESEARQAEEVVHRYGLSKQCFIGRPGPSMTYWLSH